jgi:alkylation response protein AidB-like acyl-CoA dehydrogenase
MKNNPAPQILRDCRILRIGEGANDLMTLSVGRRVAHSAPLRALLRIWTI